MIALTVFIAALSSSDATARRPTRHDRTIARVEDMVSDPAAQRLARSQGLNLVNVTWEDTGRAKNSALGPNISDMTIGVRDSQGSLHPMPVFRFNNFHDKTADIEAKRMWLRTGNASGEDLQSTRLIDVLEGLRKHLHNPYSLRSRSDSVLSATDTHLLVSAQACFLPIASTGKATFTPVLYNYQSRPGDPAVMTIVATREGTSIQVVENASGYMSEELFFNENGERAPFTATRLSTFRRNGGDGVTAPEAARENTGLDVVLVIQVPLQHTPRRGLFGVLDAPQTGGFSSSSGGSLATLERARSQLRSDVESTVVGHGPTEGPHPEINDLAIKRDHRFPIRVTVQFYKATSNGMVTAEDVADLREQIDRVYAGGDFVGSLVTGGITERPTEWTWSRQNSRSRWARPIESWHKAF